MLRRIFRNIIKKLQPNPSLQLQKKIFADFLHAISINSTLSDQITLPERYGLGLPERVVEILFAWLTLSPGVNVLDVGYANAMLCHRLMMNKARGAAKFTGLDIAVPTYNASAYYNSQLQADITGVPLPAESFDLVWCISLLEHVGMDNTGYTESFQQRAGMDLQAVHEMLRLLRPGGKLLITVPFGKRENLGWLRNYDFESLQILVQELESQAQVRQWFFQHTFGSGWHQTSSKELQYVGYYDQNNFGAGALAVIMAAKKG